jgi:hypothetical protein
MRLSLSPEGSSARSHSSRYGLAAATGIVEADLARAAEPWCRLAEHNYLPSLRHTKLSHAARTGSLSRTDTPSIAPWLDATDASPSRRGVKEIESAGSRSCWSELLDQRA